MGTVCVEVAVRDDPRVLAALQSLDRQTRRPDRVLVAGSSATPPELVDAIRQRFPTLSVEFRAFPGGVVQARSASLGELRDPVTAFLDSDEQAPPEWLERLVAPVEAGTADFSGGPTRPLRSPQGAIERYSVLLEESIYSDLVPRKVAYLPLQNTAWRTEVLRTLGFDARIPFAEDHDLESRAARAGLVGTFQPEAWVYHDAGGGTSFPRWIRKRYRYLVAMAMSLMKNGELGSRIAERRRPVAHPLRYLEAAMKPVALVHASVRWHRVCTPAERATPRPPVTTAPPAR
jgi:GT2 family glycosyltransferase